MKPSYRLLSQIFKLIPHIQFEKPVSLRTSFYDGEMWCAVLRFGDEQAR